MNNSSKIEYTLNKEHNSISCHLVRHNAAAGVVNIVWISTADNIEDALTNILTEAKREKLFGDWIFEVTNCISDQGDQMNTAVVQQLGVRQL